MHSSRRHHRRGSWRAFRNALRGDLPRRYGEGFREPFDAFVRAGLAEGGDVLDVGPGRRPTVPVPERPRGTSYVALDPSRTELELAPHGAYDETIVADVAEHLAALEERFGLIVSWNALEHVPRLDAALANLRSYLVPGGRLVAQFAGGRSAHAALARVLPDALGARVVARVMNRPPDTVFETHYDRCHYSKLDPLLASFSSHAIVTHYRDARYFRFSRLAQALYLGYEEWALLGDRRDLASHYLVCAQR